MSQKLCNQTSRPETEREKKEAVQNTCAINYMTDADVASTSLAQLLWLADSVSGRLLILLRLHQYSCSQLLVRCVLNS